MADVTAVSIISRSLSLRNLRRRQKKKPRMMQIMREPPAVPAPMPAWAPVLRPMVTGAWVGVLLTELVTGTWVGVLAMEFVLGTWVWVLVMEFSTVTVVVDVIVIVVFAFATEVTICRYVVKYVEVARTATVVVLKRFDVVTIVTVLIVDVIVDTTFVCRFWWWSSGKGSGVISGVRSSDAGARFWEDTADVGVALGSSTIYAGRRFRARPFAAVVTVIYSPIGFLVFGFYSLRTHSHKKYLSQYRHLILSVQ
jgi:hypothetical protein